MELFKRSVWNGSFMGGNWSTEPATIEDIRKAAEAMGFVVLDPEELRGIDCIGQLSKLLREYGID